MSLFDQYLDPGDIVNIVGIMPIAAVTVMFMTGQIPADATSLATFYGGATTVATALFALGHYIDKQPVCTKMDCVDRLPPLPSQGYK